MEHNEWGDGFWEAVRRARTAGNRKYPMEWSRPVAWVPLDQVERYRAVDRDVNVPLLGGDELTIEEVDNKEKSLREKGFTGPGFFIFDDNKDLMQQGEGHHRSAAARRLKDAGKYGALTGFGHQPMYVVRGDLNPRESTHYGSLIYPSHATPVDPDARFGGLESPTTIQQLKEAGAIEYDPKKPGSPEDRATVKAMSNKEEAKKYLKAMIKAGRVLGPIGGALGILAGQDPVEAMAAGLLPVEKTGGGLDKRTAKDKKAAKAYYAKKQADAEKKNPLAAYGKRGSKRKK